ncbi:MAG: hypothetical protein ABI867_28135 [Kofleriaceae bacterium]
MSRSVVVMVIAWAMLMTALVVVGKKYWPLIEDRSHLELVIVGTVALLAGTCAASTIRRIVDPSLGTPIIIWVVSALFFVIWVISLFTNTRRRDDHHHHHGHHHHHHHNRRSSYDSSYDSSSSSNTIQPSSFVPSDKGMGVGFAVFATIIALICYGAAIWYVVYVAGHPDFLNKAKKPVITAKAPAAKPTPAPTPTPVPKPVAAPADELAGIADLAAAIAFARPKLTDSRHSPSEGAKVLARWAAAKLTWADVAVAKSETSPALVEKEPPKQIGKRMCATGTLERIESATIEGVALSTARLVTKEKDALELYVVGSTGDLVKRKSAKFCGVVTGRLDVDGKPATFAVGMFELPANK